MADPPLDDLMRRLAKTKDEEILCSECLVLVVRYVDLELAGEDAMSLLPQLKQHLDQCSACREDYEMLYELAQAQEEGKL
jgi:hypothetical protein